MKRFLLILFLSFLAFQTEAQDLNARVQVLTPKIQSPNRKIVESLEKAMSDFLNTRKWSSDNFKAQERIDCNFIITITDWDGSSPNFVGEAQIQSSRPVFNSSYNSTILSINDKNFDFYYAEGQALDFSDQNYLSNLTSLLAFYANVIVGMDYDSFGKLGGSNYYSKAQNILNNAQVAPNLGWKAFEGLRNRFWLIENLNNKSFLPIREALYTYHRNGLDVMADNPNKGRQAILETLPNLERIDPLKQGSLLTQLFFTAKSEELVNILAENTRPEKLKAYEILSKLDPANNSKYEELKK